MSEEVTAYPKLGGFVVSPAAASNYTINMLLWGPSGAGKTVLAGTFPGKKLWILFDPAGTASLQTQDDILVLDLSGEPNDVVLKFRDPNPLGLLAFIKEHGISTIVVDSLTSFQEKALAYGVKHAAGTRQHASATLEDPGYGGYGRRKTWTMMLILNILQVGLHAGCHTCFISHEDSPTTNDKGEILYIGMLLGSDMPDKAGLQVGEIWNLVDTGTERRVLVRPARLKKPIKTRMFEATSPEFIWKYNQSKPDHAHTVAAWYERWKANQFRKIPLPS